MPMAIIYSKTLHPLLSNPSKLPFSFSSPSLKPPLKCSSLPPIKSLHTETAFDNAVDILRFRGLIDSLTTDSLRGAASAPSRCPLRVYCGFDPTAPSLHLGNLVGLIVLSWFRLCGHHVLAVIGGATARIGDPSGKSLERPQLDLDTLQSNTSAIHHAVSRILANVTSVATPPLAKSSKDAILDPNSAQSSILCGSFKILNNLDWWKDRLLLDFLREEGKLARVGGMITKESVKRRLELEEGLSYTEFTYQLLQGSDFLHLFRNEGVNVQIGGSDQWGNITAGTQLIRKKLQVDGIYGMTFPLLLKSDGTKFGKSEGGAIWLSPLMLSPYRFYQYFFTVLDADVVRFLKILTFISLDEIAELEKGMKSPDYVPNSLQRRLAEEVTRLVHGKEGLSEALKATEALRPGAAAQLDSETIKRIAEDVPSCLLAPDQVLNASLVDLSVSTGLLATKSAARRMLKQGGLYLNNRRIDDDAKLIELSDIVNGELLLLSAGKKKKMVVRIS